MKKILIILLLFNLNFDQVASIEPEIFVQSTVNRASQILSENISKEEKMNKLKSIAKDTVDIRGVGFYSLGQARKNLDNNQISYQWVIWIFCINSPINSYFRSL